MPPPPLTKCPCVDRLDRGGIVINKRGGDLSCTFHFENKTLTENFFFTGGGVFFEPICQVCDPVTACAGCAQFALEWDDYRPQPQNPLTGELEICAYLPFYNSDGERAYCCGPRIDDACAFTYPWLRIVIKFGNYTYKLTNNFDDPRSCANCPYCEPYCFDYNPGGFRRNLNGANAGSTDLFDQAD